MPVRRTEGETFNAGPLPPSTADAVRKMQVVEGGFSQCMFPAIRVLSVWCCREVKRLCWVFPGIRFKVGPTGVSRTECAKSRCGGGATFEALRGFRGAEGWAIKCNTP